MENFLARITLFFEQSLPPDKLAAGIWFVLANIGILILFKFLRKLLMPVVARKWDIQIQYLVDKVLHYTGIVIVVLTVFNRFGINFSALLGAAGIVGIAIGFAAQTSVSNVISGVFIMTERAFKIGDVLQIDGVTGTVESVDLLSIRLRTAENQLVRIPNETIIKTNLINITHYPLRRATLSFSVAYGTDLGKIREVLLDLASMNEFAVKDPEPVVNFDSFASSGIDIVFGVWAPTDQYLNLKNSLMIEMYERFAVEGIVIPYPRLDVRSIK